MVLPSIHNVFYILDSITFKTLNSFKIRHNPQLPPKNLQYNNINIQSGRIWIKYILRQWNEFYTFVDPIMTYLNVFIFTFLFIHQIKYKRNFYFVCFLNVKFIAYFFVTFEEFLWQQVYWRVMSIFVKEVNKIKLWMLLVLSGRWFVESADMESKAVDWCNFQDCKITLHHSHVNFPINFNCLKQPIFQEICKRKAQHTITDVIWETCISAHITPEYHFSNST